MYSQENMCFIISLPRSGSTLLQSILAQHSSIKTTSEPWILLKIADIDGSGHSFTVADYSFKDSNLAVNDFFGELKLSRKAYLKKLRGFHLSLLQLKHNEVFIDKTPRYYLIIDFLKELYPNSKLIFLTRDPIDVFHSISNTWWANKLRPHHHYVDLFKGTKLIDKALVKYGKGSLVVRYEDIISDPDTCLENIFNFLNIQHEKVHLENINPICTKSVMGDKKLLAQKSLIREQKRIVLNSRVKKIYIKKYIKWLDKNIVNPELKVSSEKYNSLSVDRLSLKRLKNEVKDLLYLTISFVSRLTLASLIIRKYKLGNYNKLD